MFDLFGKKKRQAQAAEKVRLAAKKQREDESRDYGSLPQIARILTNGDEQVAGDMALLASGPAAFREKYPVWCEEVLTGISNRRYFTLLALGYWLTGYGVLDFTPPCQYGGYIDWKEETGDILWNLEKPVHNLGYPLSLRDIPFDGEEFTHEALQKINEYCNTKDYALVSLDTDGDCYHLFIVKARDFDRLIELGNEIQFKFSNRFD